MKFISVINVYKGYCIITDVSNVVGEVLEDIIDGPDEKPKKQKKKDRVKTLLKSKEVSDEKENSVIEEISALEEIEHSATEDKPLEDKPKLDKMKKMKLTPMKIERVTVEVKEAQHPSEVEGPQFARLKLKKPQQKPKQKLATVTLPKFQLKSRIKYVNDWPPEDNKPSISFLGSKRQNGELSRNMKEAAKIKRKPVKVPEIPDLEPVELEKIEKFDYVPEKLEVSETKIPSHSVEEIKEVIAPKPLMMKAKLQKEKEPEINAEKNKKPEKQYSTKEDVQDTIIEPVEKLHTDTYETKDTLPEDDVIDEMVPDTIQEIVETMSDIKKIKKIKKDKPAVPVTLKESETIEKPFEIIEEDLINEKLPVAVDEQPYILEVADKIEEIQPDILDEQPKKEKPKKIKKLKKSDGVRNLDNEDKQTVKEILMENIEESNVSEAVDAKFDEPIKDKPNKFKQMEQHEIEMKPSDENRSEVSDNELTVTEPKKQKPKLVPMKIERKVLQMGEVQHAGSVEGPQFTKLKLKKTVAKPKQDTATVILPKFQLKSRITRVKDWPPEIIRPVVSFLGSVRQNGILSRNVKEAAKIKKKVYKQPELPELEKTELEKPMFGHEDIVDSQKTQSISEDQPVDENVEEEPGQFTIKPRRPSIKKTEEISDEVTIKKKLKPVQKPSITLPEITEPETVTFRPRTTKTKEDVEQEFNIQLDSYAEEEISLTSKVKLKPQRRPTFDEAANETSIKFYEEEDGPDIVEIIESDVEQDEKTADIMMPLKKTKKTTNKTIEDSTSSVTVSKPKAVDETSEVSQDVSLKLERKPKYVVDDQEEVSFDVKPHVEQFTTEELSLSSKIKLKSKKKMTMSEAADEASIQLTQEIEGDSQVEEIVLSEAESDDNVEMIIKRKPKKPAYEVSEIEELSVELKPKKINESTYEEEQLTISAKRKPRKPSQIQGIMQIFFNQSTGITGFWIFI